MKEDSGEDDLTSRTFTEELPNTPVGTGTIKRSSPDVDSYS